MQSKEELEQWYYKEDPWKYKVNDDDISRRNRIVEILNQVNNQNLYERILDIGAGEGFVTEKLPSKILHGIEISDRASQRFPQNVQRVLEPENKYDLVLTTGTLYPQYDHSQIKSWIDQAKSKHVLVAGIQNWLIDYSFGNIIFDTTFPYREFTQRVIVYEVSA